MKRLMQKIQYKLYAWDMAFRVWIVRKILGCDSFIAGNGITVYGEIDIAGAEENSWAVGVTYEQVENSSPIRPALRIS